MEIIGKTFREQLNIRYEEGIKRETCNLYSYQIPGGAIPGIFCACFFFRFDRGSLLLDDYVWRTTQYHHRGQNRE